MKNFIVLTAAATLSAPVLAGPYVNVETNASYTGSDYTNATTDLHVGWEGDISDSASYFIQGGPAIVAVDGTDNDTQLSGKLGGNVDLSEKLGIYREISVLTASGDTDNAWGTKLGAKYSF